MDFRTDRKIIVFESDDWGSIRMSTKGAWKELLRLGYAVDKRPYERFDTLESPEDLEALFEVLTKFKDCKGNHPIITANMLMVNPDFEKIKKSGFQDYYFEPIEETYKFYFGNDSAIKLMHQGLKEGVFMPQCHGREHFNVSKWIHGLQTGDEDLLVAFKYGMCGIAPRAHPELGNQMMMALYAETEEEQKKIDVAVVEGLDLFEKMWGFKSKSFVAPCYCWCGRTEEALANKGVRVIQTSRAKKAAYQSPISYYYSGERNKYKQRYSIRNCTFEPSTKNGDNQIDVLMKQVERCFFEHKIAIISSHRVNYVNGIDPQNRRKTLKLLNDFIKELLLQYPDLEFMSSDKLVELLEK